MKTKSMVENKKGIIANTVNMLIAGAIGFLVLAGVMVGISAFKTSQVTNAAGCNATVNDACNLAYNLTRNTELLSNNFGSQLGTVGTMFGVSLIIGAIGLLGFGVAVGASRLE